MFLRLAWCSSDENEVRKGCVGAFCALIDILSVKGLRMQWDNVLSPKHQTYMPFQRTAQCGGRATFTLKVQCGAHVATTLSRKKCSPKLFL